MQPYNYAVVHRAAVPQSSNRVVVQPCSPFKLEVKQGGTLYGLGLRDTEAGLSSKSIITAHDLYNNVQTWYLRSDIHHVSGR